MVTDVKHWESILWRSPQWLAYSVAIGLSLLTLIMRAQYQSVLGDQAVFVFFTVPVAIAALLGGLFPGLVATATSVIGGTFFFLVPTGTVMEADRAFSIAAFAGIWTFISIVCDALRRTARAFAKHGKTQEVQKNRLETILNSITDGFFAVDRDWIISEINPAFTKMMAKPDRELLGRDLWDLMTGTAYSDLRVKMAESKRTGEPLTMDFTLPRGQWCHWRAYPSADGMFVYVQDITEQKQLEARRSQLLADERKARSAAEAANRLKDDFVANLSHELRTPLTTMLGWTEILRARHGDEPDIVDGLASIEKSARHQAQLIDDLLDMSRALTGKLELDYTYLSLSDVAYEVAESFIPTADAHGIVISVEPAAEPDLIRGDSKRVFQILGNLVSNAVKFTPTGGKIRLVVERKGERACVAVHDTGEGIDPEFLPYLFDRFRQANSTTSRRHGGLGLGLSIVKHLTELQDGTVSAKSEGKGRGSVFELTFPLSGPAEHLGAAPTGVDFPEDVLRGLRILVVDDDAQTLEMLRTYLEDHRAHVIIASSASEALFALSQNPIDVLLSDIGMPEMDGYSLIAAIRDLPPEDNGGVPSLALSAFATEADRQRAIEAGFQQHLSKPVNLSRLVHEIARIAPPR